MIKFGPSGSSGLSAIDGVNKISEAGLNAMEVPFTYGVRMSNDTADELGKAAKKAKVDLSIHAPYYINLASDEKEKIEASITRILDSCERGHHMGATHVVFHAGFYQKKTKEQTYSMIKESLARLRDELKSNKWNVLLAPETTGKASQFGDIDELMSFNKELGTNICVDFAHILARNVGKIDYDDVMKKLKPLKHVHSHFSGIEYTEKGERKHKPTPDEEIKKLLSYLIKYKVDITIINESPEMFNDSLKAKAILQKLT